MRNKNNKNNPENNETVKSTIFLKPEIIKNFRESINKSPIFYADEAHNKGWSLICAAMERVEDCVTYLNASNDRKLNSEVDFINFMNFCCIISDAISKVLEWSRIENKPEDESEDKLVYFKSPYNQFISKFHRAKKISYEPDDNMSDEKFFKFLRSIIFAHPLDTSRSLSLKGGTIYSPFVSVSQMLQIDCSNAICIMIYSDIADDMSITFSTNIINDYINSRYELLKTATSKVDENINSFNYTCSMRKVKMNLKPIDTLKDCIEILSKRYKDYTEISDAIAYLECKVGDSVNKAPVNQYIQNIILKIPTLCDWIDKGLLEDYETIPFFKSINVRPENLPLNIRYDIGKIFSYLNDSVISFKEYIKNRESILENSKDYRYGNYDWGLRTAISFFGELGKDYINFNVKDINSWTEIKLLINTVLFLESENQKNGIINEWIIKYQEAFLSANKKRRRNRKRPIYKNIISKNEN